MIRHLLVFELHIVYRSQIARLHCRYWHLPPRIPPCWPPLYTYTGAWCKRATYKEVRSTRAERKGATISTNVDNEQDVCYAISLMHGLKKRRGHSPSRKNPAFRSQISQGGSSRTTEIPQLCPATWPRRYWEGIRVSHPHACTLPISLTPMRSFEALAPLSVRQKKKTTSRWTKSGRWSRNMGWSDGHDEVFRADLKIWARNLCSNPL